MFEKAGVSVMGVAESHAGREGDVAVFAGVVSDARGRVEAFAFARATVGALDATDAVLSLWDSAGAEHVAALVVSGVAPAWFNLVDVRRLHREIQVPVVCVSYEEGDDLDGAIAEAFDAAEAERRLEVYRRQPPRYPVDLSTGETVHARALGVEAQEAARLLDALTTHGKRPEPVRVAGLASNAALGLEEAA